jgi:radical SAM superfamily enzyme YgiQ (UPF0313 family)
MVKEMKFSIVNPSLDVLLQTPEKAATLWLSHPLGILYVATILKNLGTEVSVIDQSARGFSIKKTVEWVKKEDPDILGFSTLVNSGRTAALIAREVKKENPNITIVFGNFHATFNAERILKKYPYVDIIVRGEGEYTSLELVECLKKEGKLKNVLGITFRKKNQIISTPDRPLIKDIDTLPFPDRELLGEYHATIVGAYTAPKKFTTILSSRGCVFKCRFCGARVLSRGIWRPRSVENIMEEIRLLASKGYKQLLFADDNFTLNPKRVVELCQEIRKEKTDIEWFYEGRVDSCSYNMLREAVKAGCRIIILGIESANQRILDYYKKRITVEQSMNAVKTARKAGMDVVVGSFIVGAPDETRQEICNTLKFAQKLAVDIPNFNILNAFPESQIWEELKMKGLLNEDQYWETGVAVSKVSPDAVSFEEVKQIVREHYLRFFCRPRQILTQIVKTLKSPYRINVVINNLNRIDPISKSFSEIF